MAKQLQVTAVDFKSNVDDELAIYRAKLVEVLGGEDEAAAAFEAQQAVFSKYEEWPAADATPEEDQIYSRFEAAENEAWHEAFLNWAHVPGERGDHFECSL